MQHSIRFFMMVGIILASVAAAAAQTPEDLAQKAAAWKVQAADAYEFPVQPGTREWSALSSKGTVEAALQIPAERLNTMSTAGLVESCLNYPFVPDIAVYDSYPLALDQLIQRFNGLRELIQRPDAGNALLARYAIMDPETAYQRWKRQQVGIIPPAQFMLIETLLARDTILAGMPLSARQELLREGLRVLRAKSQSRSYRQDAYLPAVMMAKTLESVDDQLFHQQGTGISPQDQQYQALIRSGGLYGGNEVILNRIVHSAEAYLTTVAPQGGQP